jgi:hypothetical protein
MISVKMAWCSKAEAPFILTVFGAVAPTQAAAYFLWHRYVAPILPARRLELQEFGNRPATILRIVSWPLARIKFFENCFLFVPEVRADFGDERKNSIRTD